MSQLFKIAVVSAVAVLTAMSLMVGGYDITLATLIEDREAREMFLISRVPRTLALIFAASAMAMSGVVMQMITQNRFVEPSTAGTAQWAGLGILGMLIFWPTATPMVRMLVASLFAFVGTMFFLSIIRRIALRNSLVVPLVGIMLGAVVSAATTFLAGTYNLLPAMSAWRSGGFSTIVEGFYEPLWAVVLVAVAIWLAADRFTVAGLGKDLASNVGANYERILLLGSTLVALAAGITSVVVGFIPFLGLIVPNLVSMVLGDDVRRNLPWVALTGVALLMTCDVIGRVVVAPMEIPSSVILGVVGAGIFVPLVLRQRRYVPA